ncbi:hypothetical protein [Planomonospora venezuelensis]|uniref:Uncharacterized protein n=1 Tax=Planomonospora venezuelensis TaxID=1999 RepID=A0A841D490_PLAVE|nr:hypothetical protein [Planomonospora venezuelensis]MBB5965071.1 hypothetical protein [Planomonospora venezuelensis]GIN05011.1 hypothetical protein Pve01_66690 [Planomonospora venezuelensis]
MFAFAQPSAGSDFRAKDHVGHLLLIYVRELRSGIVTQFGTSDAISCDVVVLTDQSGPRLEPGVLFFQKPLIGSLTGSIGRDPVLARLGQGTAKPGQSAPYILQPYTEQDAAYATQYLNNVGGNPFQTAPSFAPAAPAPAPVAPLPQAVPQAAPVAPVGYPSGAPAVAAQPIPQAPAPAALPVPQPAAPGQMTAEAQAAMAALGMQTPPMAPAQ